jgi:hypothetical protein
MSLQLVERPGNGIAVSLKEDEGIPNEVATLVMHKETSIKFLGAEMDTCFCHQGTYYLYRTDLKDLSLETAQAFLDFLCRHQEDC